MAKKKPRGHLTDSRRESAQRWALKWTGDAMTSMSVTADKLFEVNEKGLAEVARRIRRDLGKLEKRIKDLDPRIPEARGVIETKPYDEHIEGAPLLP